MADDSAPMRRPTVPEADQEIGVRHPVLSHGFVALVDYMGNDAAIVQAARVSYGQGTRSVRDDKGLIRYLMRHRHTTPFEMVEYKFLVRLPVYVARQWIRHRTACLAEGTRVIFDLPGGVRRGTSRRYAMKVEDLWQKFQPTRHRAVGRPRNPYYRRQRVQRMFLRQLDEETRQFRHTRIVGVTKNGLKPVFRMTLEDGQSIECTADHRFLFDDGWSTLGTKTGLRELFGRAVWDGGEYSVCVNGAAVVRPALYQDRTWLEQEYITAERPVRDLAEVCGVLPDTIRLWVRRHGLALRAEGPHRFALGPRPTTPRRLAVVRVARAEPASDSGKEGVSREGEGIGEWTNRVAPGIHERNHWTCQLCHHRSTKLHAHHIVPVWVDVSRARDPSNLTTLCEECHREVHRDEQAYVERLGGTEVSGPRGKLPRVAWNRVTVARWASIERFEFVGLRMTYDVEVEGPSHNFVANGIVTHNSVNEYSARYSVVPDEFEIPLESEVRHQSSRNRQGRGEPLPSEVVERFRRDLERISKDSYAAYTRALESGVARETARLLLPVAYYTQWYWKCNLWNLFHFLSLRLDPHAQEEIRLYAAEMAQIARLVAPVAYEAFEEFTLSSLSLSRREQVAVRALLEGRTPEAACAEAGLPLTREDGKPMTSGEGVEFLEKLQRLRSTT